MHLLFRLYGQIVITPSVYDEVANQSKPGSEQIKKAEYLKIENVQDKVAVELLLASFGKGEAEVLALAKEKQADIVLVDERKARKAVRRAGFSVIGVLGVLIIAKKKNLIRSVKPLIEDLCRQGFRLSRKVIERTLMEAGEL